MIKSLHKLGIEGNFLDLIKGIFESPTANIIFNGDISVESFTSEIGNKTRMPVTNTSI